jgi:preprotein translocase subunit SecD
MKQEIATGAINGFNMALSTYVSMVMFVLFYALIFYYASVWRFIVGVPIKCETK